MYTYSHSHSILRSQCQSRKADCWSDCAAIGSLGKHRRGGPQGVRHPTGWSAARAPLLVLLKLCESTALAPA